MNKTLITGGHSNRISLTLETKEKIKEAFLAQLNRKDTTKSRQLRDFAVALQTIMRNQKIFNGVHTANLLLKVISDPGSPFLDAREPNRISKTGLLEIISTDFNDPIWHRPKGFGSVSIGSLSEIFGYLNSAPEIVELRRAREIAKLHRTRNSVEVKEPTCLKKKSLLALE